MVDISNSILAAEKVLKEIENKKGNIVYPINPFELLNEKNVIITFSKFDNLEGILLYDLNRPIVSINVDKPITRQRFTAAHELGHMMLHTKLKTDKFICPISDDKTDIEKEADVFASNLLMPTIELNKQIDLYQDSDGKVGLDECLLIAEYFGVSFESCVKTICFRLKRFDKDLDNDNLTQLIKSYKPGKKRKELFEESSDLNLLLNAIEYSHFSTANLNRIIGIKFVQNLVYHDSRIEKINISRTEVNGVFADLRVKGSDSIYCKSNNQNIIESLGNIEMNKYCLETEDEIDIYKLKTLNKLLYKYSPYPEYAGEYRCDDNMILGGKRQPISFLCIAEKMEEINDFINNIKKNINKYSISEYIMIIAKIHYELTILHPFTDGNGRTIRAFTNWFLRLKGLSPIYIDSSNRDLYLDALHRIDNGDNYDLLQIIIVKSMIKTMVELHESWQ